MTHPELAAEIGRLLGSLFHSHGSLERAVEEIEQEIKGWRDAITPSAERDERTTP